MAMIDKKYFTTEQKIIVGEAPWSPKFEDNEAMRLLSLGNEVIKGSFYMETAWFLPGEWPKTKGDIGTIKAHKHDFDETIAWVGTNPKDPYNLNGEIEIWVDGKKNILDRSFLAFIPAGTVHGPIKILKIDKPMFHFTAGMEKKYLK